MTFQNKIALLVLLGVALIYGVVSLRTLSQPSVSSSTYIEVIVRIGKGSTLSTELSQRDIDKAAWYRASREYSSSQRIRLEIEEKLRAGSP